MKKRILSAELAYVLGLVALAAGTALMERADYGVSMVVAPAYLVFRRLSVVFPWFSFGMAEYLLQGVLLAAMILILRRFRWSYLVSFATAVLYGLLLDGAMALVPLPAGAPLRLLFFAAGMLLCSLGVSLLFHTYLSPEVYELLVKELSRRYGWEIHRVKTCYDCISCLTGVLLSFLFFGFGRFEGVKAGTVFCALVNGTLIGCCTRFLERHWEFRDRFPWRAWFEAAV